MYEQVMCATDDYGVPATLRSLLAWSGQLPGGGSERMRLAQSGAAKQAVLFMIDGLGWDQWQKFPPDLVERFDGTWIPTVSASTTVAALTSCTTGVVPGTHGIVASDMLIAGRTLSAIRWKVPGKGAAPDPLTIQPIGPFGGVSVPVVSPAVYEGSGLTKAHLRGGRYFGWETPYGMVERVRGALCSGAPVVYAYYPFLDRTCHGFGVHSIEASVEREQVAAILYRAIDQLPERTGIYVTADHGLVDVAAQGWLRFDDLDRMILHHTGEGRMRMCHVAPGAADEVVQALRARFSDCAWIWTRDAFVEEGWLGTATPSAAAVSRLGDVILGAFPGYAFESPTSPRERRLVAHHGSVTAPEMQVPWLMTLVS